MSTALAPTTGFDPDAKLAAPLAFVRHSLVLAGRNVRKIRRTPEQLMDVTLQPIMFLVLFVYLFGGAVAGSTHAYLEYVLPALMVQNAAFGSVSIGVNLNTDVEKGVFDRFRSLPIPRPSPLVGAVLAEVVRYAASIVVLLGFGYILGFRIHTNPLDALLASLLVIVFALSMCWISVFLGMVLRTSGAVQGIGFLFLFPLTFGSNIFVPTGTLPGWLQDWVKINPVTHVVQMTRGLLVSGPVTAPIVWTLVASAVLVAVFAPLAVAGYRRKA